MRSGSGIATSSGKGRGTCVGMTAAAEDMQVPVPSRTIHRRTPQSFLQAEDIACGMVLKPREAESPYEDRLRCFLPACQRCLDRAHYRTGVERLAGKEYAVSVRSSQHRLRFACSWCGVGISAAREWILGPVDCPRRDEFPPDAVHRQIENLAERGESHLDEFGLGKRRHPVGFGSRQPTR